MVLQFSALMLMLRPAYVRGVPRGRHHTEEEHHHEHQHHDQRDRIDRTIDTDRLMSFVFRAVDEVGATLNAALVVLGDELGYYRALADHGPMTAAELAVVHRHRRALRPRVAQRPGGRLVRDLRPGHRPLHAARRARGRPHRRVEPGVPAGAVPDRGRHRRRRRPDRRRRPPRQPASAGTSTTATCTTGASGSSGPATTPTWSRSGCRRSAWPTGSARARRSPTSAAATAPPRC